MKLSSSFFITRKEDPNDESTLSSNLLVRSGMIDKISNGEYIYLPLGLKTIENIKNIIREELNKLNSNEVLMPSLVNDKIFKQTNSIELYDKELFKIIDRDSNHLCLCPSYEELFAFLADKKINSYKDLHFFLYQISNKYRDEESIKGLNRQKEFIVADAYSFDASESGLSISYDTMYHTFSKILKRLNINYLVAESCLERVRGNYSEEFHTLCEKGDNEIVKCTNCTYTANKLIAEVSHKRNQMNEENHNKKMTKINTENARNVKDLVDKYHMNPDNIIRSLIYKVNNKEYIMVLMKCFDEVNIIKLRKALKCKNIKLASQEEIEDIGGCFHFLGPIKATMKVIADHSIRYIDYAVCGSNTKGYHYINVRPKIDFKIDSFSDLKLFDENDKCPICKSNVNICKTIEIADIFKLGSTFSDAFNLKYNNEKNELARVHMGSYSIGIDRCLTAIVENNHDENGIVWPIEVSPYKVYIIVVNVLDKEALRYSVELYNKLSGMNIDTILDDRRENPGVKFKDSDLIGIPIRITVGYKSSENIIELKYRNREEIIELKKQDVIENVKNVIFREK